MYLYRIKELRIEEHLSQARIAKVINVTQKTYSRYERGERDISISSLIEIADFFDTSVDYLVGNTDVRDKYPKGKNENPADIGNTD